MLRISTLTFYGLPALPVALLGLPLYVYLPTFYAAEIGLGVAAVGSVLLAARLFDMVTDPLIGIVSDRLNSRKAPMLAGAVLLMTAFFALAHPVPGAGALWLLFFSLLVYTGWSLLSIPYLALGAELSPDYHEKTRLAAARESGAILGAVLALTLPYTLGIAEDAAKTLALMWQVLLLLLPAVMLAAWYGIPEPGHNQAGERATLRALKPLFRRSDGTLRLMAAYFFNSLANAFPATLFLFFVGLVLAAPERTGLLLVLYFASGLLALPLWTLLAKRIGKRGSWMFSMLLASAVFAYVPFLGAGDTTAFTLVCLFSGLSLGADMALPAAIQSDIANAAEARGERLSGVLFGLWSTLTKLALALSVGIAFGLLGFAGFDPAEPTPAALTTLGLLYGAVPVALKIIALLLLRGFREIA